MCQFSFILGVGSMISSSIRYTKLPHVRPFVWKVRFCIEISRGKKLSPSPIQIFVMYDMAAKMWKRKERKTERLKYIISVKGNFSLACIESNYNFNSIACIPSNTVVEQKCIGLLRSFHRCQYNLKCNCLSNNVVDVSM